MKDIKLYKIDKAITEAERFLETAHQWNSRLLNDKYAIFGCKEGGACKRASLDLTRALADLRRP